MTESTGRTISTLFFLAFFNNISDSLATSLVEKAVANLDVLKCLLESESHATADDKLSTFREGCR